MFTIYGGKDAFDQWDQGQRVTCPGLAAGDKVTFLNCTGETHPMKAYSYNGEVVCDVPNDLLRMARPSWLTCAEAGNTPPGCWSRPEKSRMDMNSLTIRKTHRKARAALPAQGATVMAAVPALQRRVLSLCLMLVVTTPLIRPMTKLFMHLIAVELLFYAMELHGIRSWNINPLQATRM